MPKPTVKEKLLNSLLNRPKTTGELAKELGYVEDGKVKYSSVEPQLKGLLEKNYVQYKKDESKPRRGPPATLYAIVYDIPVLVKILEEYPALIPDIQKNDDVLRLIVEKHKSALFNDVVKVWGEKLSHPMDGNLTELLAASHANSLLFCDYQKLKKEFIQRLQWSHSYFELYLKEDVETISERGRILIDIRISLTSCRKKLGEKIRGKFFLPREMFVFDIIFESCVETDIQMGNFNVQAIEYLNSRTHTFQIFNDETIDSMNSIFMKNQTLLETERGQLEDCSKEELIHIYKFKQVHTVLMVLYPKEVLTASEEELVDYFHQQIQEGRLEKSLKNRYKDVKFLDSLLE